jgi:peptidoglycan/xylan/chitin deacetylase (PgdA/CDA1 family)
MLTVCNYHYIRPSYKTKYPSIFGVTTDAFRKQIKLLSNTGKVIKPATLLSNAETILGSKDNYILITFDDGLKEQYVYALPILEEFNTSAVFFANSNNTKDKKVSTVHKIHLLRSIIDSKSILSRIEKDTNTVLTSNEKQKAQQIYTYDNPLSAELKYLLNYKIDFKLQEELITKLFDNYFSEEETLQSLYMNKAQIIDLAQKESLGSHTHNHYPLSLINEDDIKFELNESKTYFESLTNNKVEMVAYPYGTNDAVNIEVANMAKQVGYKYGFTTNRGTNTTNENNLLFNRFDCNDLIGGKNYKP